MQAETKIFVGGVSLILFALCGQPGRAAPIAAWLPQDATIQISYGDRRVGTVVSAPSSFSTNVFWIEGPTGLILIDTAFLLSDAAEAIEFAEKATGKKVVMAVILHPNPDKFNGTQVLQKHGVLVLTSSQVLKLIPSIHRDRYASFYQRYKPDYPEKAPRPQSFGDKNCELKAAGLTLNAYVMGAGVSEDHVVVKFEDHVFVGDLVANLNHSWLEIGKTDEWLKRLNEIRALKPKYVHPGRGPSGGPELLDREEAYLRRVIFLVDQLHPQNHQGQPLSDAELNAIKSQLEKDYPGFGNSYFLFGGLPAEWRRQQAVK